MKEEIMSQPQPEFYTVGGAVKPTALCYLPRSADVELMNALLDKQYCYILTPRQMGKTSLIARTMQSLRQYGISCAKIDLTGIGTTNITNDQWYLSQIKSTTIQLQLNVDYLSWWKDQEHLGSTRRFVDFFREVVVPALKKSAVIFVDEIDSIQNLSDLKDDYFAAIRSLYNERAFVPALEKISFVLVGVASPSELIQDVKRTPFNIGKRIQLSDFNEDEAKPLAVGLAPDNDQALALLKQVLLWTNGHPYLTQKTCNRVAQWAKESWNPSEVPVVVDDLVRELFIAEGQRQSDDNLRFVRDRVIEVGGVKNRLEIYRQIREGNLLTDSDRDPLITTLKLSGIVKTTDQGTLTVRNNIYNRVFDESWIRSELHKAPDQKGDQVSESKKIFKYDAFLSYGHRDEAWVLKTLLPKLESGGLRVAIDVRDFIPGVPSIVNMERIAAESRYLILVMSPSWVASEWTNIENLILQSTDPAALQARLIPLMIKESNFPGRLSTLSYLDFTKQEYQAMNMKQLLSILGAKKSTTGKEHEDEITSVDHIQYNTNAIRELIQDGFSQEEFRIFVYDFYRAVYGKFTPDMSFNWQIQLIIEYAEERDQLGELVDHIAELRPRQYKKFERKIILSSQ
jgi:hypothetical protein